MEGLRACSRCSILLASRSFRSCRVSLFGLLLLSSQKAVNLRNQCHEFFWVWFFGDQFAKFQPAFVHVVGHRSASAAKTDNSYHMLSQDRVDIPCLRIGQMME